MNAVVRLGDAGVSRQHAMIDRDGDRVILTDLGSVNGTFVNGRPLRGWSHDLRSGDVIHLGQVELVYEVDRHQSASNGSRTGGVRIGRVVLVAAAISIVGWLVPALITFIARKDVGLPAWLVAPGAAVVTGVVQSVFEATMNRSPPETNETRQTARRTGVPAGVAILVILLVVGVGGYAAAVGIRYGVGWITGNEDQVGRERLVSSPAPSGTSGRVRVTVTSIVNTAHFTRVALTVRNQESEPATITLFGNCSLTGGSVTLEPDSFKSKWVETVPPNSTQQGHLIFPGHLPDSATTAQLSINRVFVFGRFGADDSLIVRSIRLRVL